MTEKTFETNFFPNPLQKQFIESRATADLFSSRRGEGKSTALAWSIFAHTKQNPGAKWALVRDTYENLKKTTMKTFFDNFPNGVYGHWHQTDKMFTWYEGAAKGEVHFVGMDNAEDATRFLSWELAGIAMDEPAPAFGSGGINESVFDLGMTCLRQPEMNWYSVKLAENNPDESHWTYKKFVEPGKAGYALFQPSAPENLAHLPPNYYESMRDALSSRPDLIRRFVDGEFGYQSEGVSVTPQWSDKIHLATGLLPAKGVPLTLCWDFGLNPTCLITQRTPLGYWLILRSFVGQGDIGALELITDMVKPVLNAEFRGFRLEHTGDPMGKMREQSSAANSAVRVIRAELGGTWRPGPVSFQGRLVPLQNILSKMIRGTGLVKVDRQRAKEVHYALRGGWHYHVANTGVQSGTPKKDIHSHPGDAMGYGAAFLFPIGKLFGAAAASSPDAPSAGYFGQNNGWRIGPQPSVTPPAQGAILSTHELPKGYF
jgi:hypothetical protein